MSVKVSQMPLAESVGEGDVLMIVQNGQSKKIPATQFQQKSEPISNSLTLEGYGADEFVKKGETATDSDALGGKEASEYATKDYVDRKNNSKKNWDWCCPRLWFDHEHLPANDDYPEGDDYHFAFCDGRWLLKDEYPELFAVIGYNYSQIKGGVTFQIPDMRGKFPFGAGINQMLSTETLPTGLYAGQKGFTPDGQWEYPVEAGVKGGDAVTTQDSTWQMANHSHETAFKGNGFTTTDPVHLQPRITLTADGDIYDHFDKTYTTTSKGLNEDNLAQYPSKASAHFNYGMLSMPPFLTFAYIMQIKPFEE